MDSRVQPTLPQFILGNEHVLPARCFAALAAACPPNVTLVRRKTGWVDRFVFRRILTVLCDALAPLRSSYQPILLLDAHRVHVMAQTFAICHAAGVWVVVIPARTTWLLQPLDTDAFSLYKLVLQKEYQAARVRLACGDLAIGDFLQCVYATISRVLHGRK